MKKSNRNSGIPIWVHIIVIGVIIGLIAFTALRLYIWNKGVDSTYDPNADTSEFDIEVLDQIFILPKEKLEGHEDDGVNTILFLGNDAITYDSSETGVVSQIASLSGSTVYNAGFPASYVSMKNASVSDDYAMDNYSFYNICQSIVNEDFSQMEADAATREDYTYSTSVYTLKDLDFNSVDTLVVYYDANDYIGLRPGMNPDNMDDPMTYYGAFSSGIKAIQEKYPFIRIVVMSFTFCFSYDSDGNLVNGGKYDFGNGSLPTYLQHIIDATGETGASFIDNYYGTVTQTDTSKYLIDNIHVNQAGNKYIAEHFVSALGLESTSDEE